nr:hypothetical protein [Aerosakkonema funiforme]
MLPFRFSVPLLGREVTLILLKLSPSTSVNLLVKSAALKLISLSSFPDLSILLTVGALSSLVILPTPWLSAIVALLGLDKLIKKVSPPSINLSPLTATEIILEVSPGLKVSWVVEIAL